MPTYLPFDPNPRRPSKLPPPKSIDSQFHVLGPLDKYPVRPGAAYQMPTATWEAALRVHKALGIERGIIVQTTTYGADHSVVLDALAAMGPNYRGCANALVFAEADDAYLAKLHDAGVRGARFSFRQELGAVLSDKDFARAIAKIRELGWYAKIQPEKDGIVSSVAKYESLDVPVLIDHMARLPQPEGIRHPAFQVVRRLLDTGRVWVKLSAPYLDSKSGAPRYADIKPIARALIEHAPERCVWGSDWPHPTEPIAKPDDAALFDFVQEWAIAEETRDMILVDNPAKLYGF